MLRPAVLILLLFLLCVPAISSAKDSDDEFKELANAWIEVRKSADWEQIKRRRALLLRIGETGHARSAKLLAGAFLHDREQICRIAAMRGLGAHAPFPVLKTMVSRALTEREDVYRMMLPRVLRTCRDPELGPWLFENVLPRARREHEQAAVIETLGHLACTEAWETLLQRLTRENQDPRLLVETLLALARIGGAQAFDPIVPWLGHADAGVRAGAVHALGETGHPALVDKILPVAKDTEIVVQVAVAQTLAAAKAEEGYPALLEMLWTGRLRAADGAYRALREISGQDFGPDPAAWDHWCRTREAPEKEGEPRSVATYHGMFLHSDRVLFVLDISGSMKAGKPSRIELARGELSSTLGRLRELSRTLGSLSFDRRVRFNVVAFGGSPVWWRDSEAPTTEANASDALKFVHGLTAGGGTNLSDTLEQALTQKSEIDTIFLLGDGSPSKGKHVEPEEILANVRWLNRLRRVRINTIAVVRPRDTTALGTPPPIKDRTRDEEEAARFMARLAEENDGTFLRIHR